MPIAELIAESTLTSVTLPLLYSLKNFLRICDCRFTQRQQKIHFQGQAFPFFTTRWWDNVTQEIFDREITPYFSALGDFQPQIIFDIGAATGHFGIVAARLFPGAKVHAFEPAERQRILLARNAKLNRVDRFEIEPLGLWSHSDTLAFRTVGAESSLALVSRFQGTLDFPEQVQVIPLDQWVNDHAIERIDLIKMDAEGAEIEILEGAHTTLTRFRPRLLVQAYHIRGGVRTFERCAAILRGHGYSISESGNGSGLLCAL